MKHKNLFIVNPNAGMKQAKNNLPAILDLFNEHGDINSVHLTQARGDGVKFAKEMAHDFDRIICIGGDGTFNEVVTGLNLAGYTGTIPVPIGYIPAGTANDLASSLKLSKNMMQVAKDIIDCTDEDITELDIGRFNERYFAYIASFGAFTKVAYSTPQASKNMLGHFAYILEGLKEISAIRPEYIKIESNNIITEGEYIFGAVSNSKSVAGIISLDPDLVDMGDGLFEIFLIKPLRNAQAVWDCVAAVINRNYSGCEHITFFTAANAVIHADPKIDWTLDGEYANSDGHKKIGIENLCRRVRVIVKSTR